MQQPFTFNIPDFNNSFNHFENTEILNKFLKPRQDNIVLIESESQNNHNSQINTEIKNPFSDIEFGKKTNESSYNFSNLYSAVNKSKKKVKDVEMEDIILKYHQMNRDDKIIFFNIISYILKNIPNQIVDLTLNKTIDLYTSEFKIHSDAEMLFARNVYTFNQSTKYFIQYNKQFTLTNDLSYRILIKKR